MLLWSLSIHHLQQPKPSKPLRGRAARWLDFLAEFPKLTITYLPGSSNQVEDALSRVPRDPAYEAQDTTLWTNNKSSQDVSTTPKPGSLTVMVSGGDPLGPATKTRGRQTDYRKLAGIPLDHTRRRQTEPSCNEPQDIPQTPELLHPQDLPQIEDEVQLQGGPQLTNEEQPAEDLTTQGEQQPQDKQQPTQSTAYTLDWPSAYAKCQTFSGPYQPAAQQAGRIVQQDIQHRRYSFRYRFPYLQINISGIGLICVPQLPEFLTYILYKHYDHMTAGHRCQKKTYQAISRHYYWPGMRTYTNAYVECCTVSGV